MSPAGAFTLSVMVGFFLVYRNSMHQESHIKSRQWKDRGNSAVDPFDAFSNYWRGFNSLYYNAKGESERDKIKSYLQSNFDEEMATTLLASHADQVAYLISQPVVDMRHNGRDTTLNICIFNSAKAASKKIEELFMIIYQVRCNFEHGQKSTSSERDIRLCRAAGPIVAEVIT